MLVTIVNLVNIFYHTGRSLMLLYKKNSQSIKRLWSKLKPKLRERYDLLQKMRESMINKENVNTEYQ